MSESAPSGTLYYVVRKDLPWDRRCVQLIHAREKYAEIHEEGRTRVHTAVVYGVSDEAVLKAVFFGLLDHKATLFHEPDLQEYTALCTDHGPLTLPLL